MKAIKICFFSMFLGIFVYYIGIPVVGGAIIGFML